MKSASSNQLNQGPYIDVQNSVCTSTPIKSTYLIKVTACDHTKKYVADGLSLFCERYIVAMAEQEPVDNNNLDESSTLFDLTDFDVSVFTKKEEEKLIESVGNALGDLPKGLCVTHLNPICYLFAGN